MFFGRITRLRHSLAFRLTLWYAAVFVLMAATTFAVIYLLLDSAFKERIDKDLLAQTRELKSVYALEGSGMLQRAAVFQVQTAGEKKMFFRLFYTSGMVFASSGIPYAREVGIDRRAVDAVLHGQDPYFVTLSLSHPNVRRLRIIYSRMGSGIILQLGYAPDNEIRLMQAFQRTFLSIMTVLLVLAIVVGWFMARRALSGVAELTRTARQISKDDLESRVPVAGRHDEVDMLAVTFNHMLDRIQSLVIGTRQMNDNIAHDLRSPVTRIRGLAEVTLLNARALDDYQQMAASTVEECDRLLAMINTMLTISRTESGISPIARQDVDFSAVVAEACDLFKVPVEDRGLRMETRIDTGLQVSGDRHLLQRLVSNLLDNAIKYTDPPGTVTVKLSPEKGGGLCLSVADTGIGIPGSDQYRIFERFFQGDPSRSQGGAGLGLSLVRSIVTAHEGRITVHSTPGEGSTFTVHLPSA